MSYNYNVTAHKPTAVSHSLAGHFTSADTFNVLLGKGNRIEIHSVSPEGLKPVLDVPMYGQLSYMELFRTKKDDKDWLFAMTSRYHVAVLAYEQGTGDVLTKAYGNVKERVGRPSEGPPLCHIDPTSSVVALHMYMGTMKFIPLSFDKGEELVAFSTRLHDVYIVAICFLTGYDTPTICYIAETPKGRCLKTFSVMIRDHDLVQGPWMVDSIDSDCYFMFPLPQPAGGVVCIAECTSVWYNRGSTKAADPPHLKDALISCYGKVDDNRYLLGDTNGYLHMLFLSVEEAMNEKVSVVSIKMERLGEVTSVRSVTYLDNGVVFVGSTWGDSQLVKLCTVPAPGTVDSYVQVLESYNNLGPIVDMVTADLDKQDHDLIVTCSGYGRDGTIRIVRSGIGIHELASVDLDGLKGVWALSTGVASPANNDMIVVSFISQTTVLSINGEELEATEIGGFSLTEQTFECGNVDHFQLIQITPSCVRLVSQQTLQLIQEWTPASDKRIGACAYNSSQVLVAIGNSVHYLEIGQGVLKEVSQITLSHEVSCVDISPLSPEGEGPAEVCVVGLWHDITVRVLDLPRLQEKHCEQLGGEIIPRSITMVTMEGISYLLVALGDGCLIYYSIDQTGAVRGRKRVVLGTKPVLLKPFIAAGGGGVNVFACSDRPTIIYSSSKKLLFSSVNLKEVNHMTTLHCEAYPNSLVLAMEDSFIIGTVDQIQKLHIRTIPLMETPRRLDHQPSTHVFAVLTVRQSTMRNCASVRVASSSPSPAVDHQRPPGCGDPGEVSSVVVFDENTFEGLFSYKLQPFENGCSILSLHLGDADCFVVGTAFVYPQEKDPNKGRLLVLKWEGGKLNTVTQTIVNGPVYALTTVAKDKVVAAVFSSVHVFNFHEGTLTQECVFDGCILALFLKSMGDFVLVGDLMRSFCLLSYKEEQLEQISLDTNLSPSYMTAVEMLDHDTFLGSDSQHIFTCQKNNDATCEADAPYMIQTSRFCVGDTVNVFRQGSLVMGHTAGSLLSGPMTLYGTINGSIGIIGQLPADVFEKLKAVETSLHKVIKSVGKIEYDSYRAFSTDHRSKPAAGFVDGDLLERFVDLPRDKMESVAMETKVSTGDSDEMKALTVEEILKIIEDLSRIH